MWTVIVEDRTLHRGVTMADPFQSTEDELKRKTGMKMG
jgi:hypothetical protein